MTGLEIILIIAGFLCLCMSYFVAQRKDPEQENMQTAAVWTEKEEQMIRQRVDDILSDRQNEVVDAAEEQMNRLCNDKIMAVDEFSKPILEKIKSNHQEVVFMYNMLNEKKKEVTDIITTIPVRRTEEKEEKEKTEKQPKPVPREKTVPKDSAADSVSEQEKNVQTAEKAAVQPERSSQSGNEKQPEPVKRPDPMENEGPERKTALNRQEATEPQTALDLLAMRGTQEKGTQAAANMQELQKEAASSERKQEASVPGSVNLQIQKMHKEGKSVLEISKALNIGQGEVKLVIALYGGRKG